MKNIETAEKTEHAPYNCGPAVVLEEQNSGEYLRFNKVRKSQPNVQTSNELGVGEKHGDFQNISRPKLDVKLRDSPTPSPFT